MNKNTNYWIITDTHFNHERIHDFCNRPKGFENKIIKNLYECVKPNDILIHLGDITWTGKSSHYDQMMALNCKRKYLIKGNHDRKTMSWYLDSGWDVCCENMTLFIHNKRIVFSHIPMTFIDANNSDIDMNIHGHFHNLVHRIGIFEKHIKDKLNHKHILLKMEHHYKPFSLRKIVEDVQKQEFNQDYYTFNKV